MDSTQSQESVNIYFVHPQDSTPEKSACDMKICFQCCVEHDLHPEWLSEDCCLELSPMKTDVFVFEKFEGAAYDYLRKSKCVRIAGPRCVLTCLIGGIPIPTGLSPIYTVGMRDLIISTTNFEEDVKKKLKETIGFMGGIFTSKLRKNVTHLVCHHVISTKQEAALKTGIPVMTEEWVWAVWAASKERNVHGKDTEFMVHKCDIFHNLSVTCSGLPRKQKESIKENICKHGGDVTGELIFGKTNLLIALEATGDKFTHASQWKIPCVLPTWIADSLEKGHVLPVEQYAVKKEVKCSTPVHDASRFLPNFSTMSSIQGEVNVTHVNETVLNSTTATMCNLSVAPANPRTPVKKSVGNNYIDVVNKLDIKDAKRAGPFLDGCKVYLSGFTTDMNEKLRRILNAGGATRFNEISESLSHIIVGDFIASEMKTIMSSNHRPHIVRVEWLLESIRNRCPVPEDRFSVTDNKQQATEPPSPLSKKGLQLLRRPSETFLQPQNLSETLTEMSIKDVPPEPDNVVQHYLNASQTEPMESFNSSNYLEEFNKDTSTRSTAKMKTVQGEPSQSLLAEENTQSSCSGKVEEIFRGLSFSIVGYDEEDTADLEDLIQTHGGRVVSRGFKGIPDYGIVPIQGERLHHTTNEVVTYLWLHDCCEKEEIVPIQYYHRPVSVDQKLKPLKGCVIGMTTYSGKDRDFVNALAQLLGAKTQETFARVDCKAKNSVASTHLVCPEPGSQKYLAAQKWNLPAVTHEWLLACAREGQRVDEKPYLVKETDNYKGECSGTSRKSSVASDKSEKVSEKEVFNPPPQGTTPRPSCSNQQVGTTKGNVESVETPTSRPTNIKPKQMPDSPLTPITPWKKNSGPHTRTTFTPETPIAHLLPSPLDMVTPENVSVTSIEGDIPTPDTPYGQVFKPNPSPATRKFWKKWIDRMPDFEKKEEPVVKRRRLSTPASELKRQLLIKCGAKLGSYKNKGSQDGSENETDTSQCGKSTHGEEEPEKCSEEITAETAGINTQLNNLEQILTVHTKVNSPRVLLRDGSSLKRVTDSSDGNSSGSSKGADLPASLDINADFVEWVDPALSDENLKPKLRFMLSSTIDDRGRYENLINRLGASLSDKPTFDPTSTHLVCNKPARNEKLLASIASGKWVLHKSYLDASEEAGHFVEEDNFEWGNPKASSMMAKLELNTMDTQLAEAAHRWRRKICGDAAEGAFKDMRAIIHASKEKGDSFARLIVAGGGQVLDIPPPYSNPGAATHCLAEVNRVKLPIDLEALARHRVPVLPPIFLNNFLVSNPPPNVTDAAIPEYKAVQCKLGL